MTGVTTSAEKMPNLPKIPINWTWIVATALSTVIVVSLLLFVYYPGIPDPMPVHWNAAGEADRFTEKTLGAFLFNILLGPIILILTLLGAEAMISMQSAYLTGPGGAKTPNEAYRTWHGYQSSKKHMGWFLFVLNLLIMVMMLRTYAGNPGRWELPLLLVAIFGLCGLLMWAMIRDQKVTAEKYPRGQGERGPAWGIFYNDPEDKRILVDTGSGSNFTFNLGRPAGKAWAVILFVLIPGVLLVWVFASASG